MILNKRQLKLRKRAKMLARMLLKHQKYLFLVKNKQVKDTLKDQYWKEVNEAIEASAKLEIERLQAEQIENEVCVE